MNKRVLSIVAAVLFLSSGNAVFARGMGGGGGHFGGGGFGGGGFGGGGGHFGGFGGGGHDFGGFGGGHDFGGGGFGDHGWGGDGGFSGGDHGGWGGGGFSGGDHGGWGGGGSGGDHGGWGGGGSGGDHGGWSGGGDHGGWNGDHGWSGDHGWNGGDHNWGGFGRISGYNNWNAGHNTYNYSPSYYRNSGALVRNNYYGGGAFWGHGWWGYHPGCWFYPGWGMGMGMAWMITDWSMMAGMLALDAAVAPSYYGYGTNITYNNNNVYYDGQQYASANDYYNQAQTLAESGNNSTSDKSVEWKPMGVFSLVQGQQTNSNMLFQLAINKNGDLGGNYYDVLTNETQQVQGKLNKKDQRVAWTIGKNKDVVYDCGLGNLMADQAPILVHFGKDRTEQWELVRLKHDQGDPANVQQKNANSSTTVIPESANNAAKSDTMQDDSNSDPEI